MTVEPVSLDYSPEVGVQGAAPPGRTVSLRLDVPGRAPELVPLTADAQGRFVLRASELSPRARWSFRDVTALRVSLPQPGGHASVAEWRAAGEDRGRPLYLPRLAR